MKPDNLFIPIAVFLLFSLLLPAVSYPQTGLGLSVSMNRPTYELGLIYRTAPGIELCYRQFANQNIEAFAEIGFTRFRPSADTYYFSDGNGGFATVNYSDFINLPALIGANYHFLKLPRVSPYAGLGFGYYWTFFVVSYRSQLIDSEADTGGGWRGFTPIIGLSIFPTDRLALRVEGRFNMISYRGDDNGFQSGEGLLNRYLNYGSVHAGLAYYFQPVERSYGNIAAGKRLRFPKAGKIRKSR